MPDLRELLRQYVVASYEATDMALSPWPNDPDGGELRIVNALQAVLVLHRQVDVPELGAACADCGLVGYPCDTVRAIASWLEVRQ